VTRWTRRPIRCAASTLLCALASARGAAAQRAEPTSLVIATGQDAPLPIPTLMEGAQGNTGNFEVADQLFLRLAGLGPTLVTTGDREFTPLLARSWSRRDSVTLAFELDPRARWHDGTPVTSRDVVFTFRRARDPGIAPGLSRLLRHLAAVEAEGDRTVVFRFTHPYGEQLYDAVYHVAPLPAHLVEPIPPAELRTSAFAAHPVGSGPYRWVRSVPGQLVELRANESFFLGRPGVERLLIRVATDADARLNLLLSGEADAMDNVPPANQARVKARGDIRLVRVPSPTLGYLLYNQRDPADHARPHPILADTLVRRALALALDRRQMVRAVLGEYGEIPYGPTSLLLWIRHGAPRPLGMDRATAGRLLDQAGWRDEDGDGVRERGGRPLTLTVLVPNTSGIRRQMAAIVQQQWRSVGVRAEIVQLDFPVWNERHNAGNFDVSFGATTQDPTPSGLTQSWSCKGQYNVAGYCDPVADSLLEVAIRGGADPAASWQAVLRRIESSFPATFLYAPVYVFAVHRRYQNVTIRPESSWSAVWRWSVRPAGGSGAVGY
jgi:peptide/nickel transport system substrate-binding protein